MSLAYSEILENKVILGTYQILLSTQTPTYSSNSENSFRSLTVQYRVKAKPRTMVPQSLQVMVTMVQKQVIISIFSTDYFFQSSLMNSMMSRFTRKIFIHFPMPQESKLITSHWECCQAKSLYSCMPHWDKSPFTFHSTTHSRQGPGDSSRLPFTLSVTGPSPSGPISAKKRTNQERLIRRCSCISHILCPMVCC